MRSAPPHDGIKLPLDTGINFRFHAAHAQYETRRRGGGGELVFESTGCVETAGEPPKCDDGVRARTPGDGTKSSVEHDAGWRPSNNRLIIATVGFIAS